jgi:phytanoyl-CoA hydroxylase
MNDHDCYKSQGYVIYKNVFSKEEISSVRRDVLALFANYVPNISEENFDESLFNLFKKDFQQYHGAAKASNHLPSFQSLQTKRKVIDILRSLGVNPIVCARALMWFHHENLAKKVNYFKLPAHQELSNMQGSESGAVAWSTLREISKDTGPLQVIPRSHLWGLLEITNINGYDYEIKRAIDDVEFVELDVKPTDLLVFSPLLVHRSGDNRGNRIRWTFNFRYNNANDQQFVKDNFFDPFLLIDPKKIVNARYMP